MKMTPKERWIASLKLEPVDHLAFWPKINSSYLNYQSGRFKNMTIDEMHDYIGSDKHVWLTGFIKEKRRSTSLEEKKIGITRKLIYLTKYGNLTATMQFDEPSQAWHPVEYPVKTKQDIEILTEWFADACLEIDKEKLQEARQQHKEIGSDAITAHSIGTTPLMQFVQHLAGIENCHYFLTDFTQEVKQLFETMQKKNLKSTEILDQYSPAEILYLVENTSTTLISPQQYRKYCYQNILDCAGLVKNSGKFLVLHMCGHLKNLLRDLASLPVSGFEALTTVPVGNTTLIEGRRVCPDKCLIGGTNAVLWTKSAKEIISEIENELDKLPHHRGLVITSAGVMPPLCKPETIKQVCQWVKQYRVRV
ncbi:MAG TPA: uroporphyrinogen decarboxylase family protein [bacterium]|mgnify:CR=1 FL=1|nr:uroporphyrinogen decarboxylase family protein [bacterium]HOL35864.1 uroporphyrinogen decarboxylase family protein [bacterium]HPP09144.1 uroporphyrinogen decarboxylase family protein [bacterium]